MHRHRSSRRVGENGAVDAEEFAVYDPLGLCPWFAGVCSQLSP